MSCSALMAICVRLVPAAREACGGTGVTFPNVGEGGGGTGKIGTVRQEGHLLP